MKKLSWPATRFRRVTANAVILAMASVAAVACDETTGPGAVTGVDVVVVPIGTPTTNLLRGSTVQLVGAPHDDNDQFVNTPITWTSSDNAKATVDANGLVTLGTGAAAGGAVTITAAAAGKTGTFDLEVQHPVGTVTLNPTTATIRQEGTVAIAATLVDNVGATVTGREVVWTSSNTGFATVNSSGVVSGVADGTVTITATAVHPDAPDVAATASVTVAGLPLVATVTITAGGTFRGVGESYQATHTSRAASGTTISGTTATWSSSNTGVLTVSATGLVTIVGPGTAQIRADVDNGAGTNVRGTLAVQGADVLANGVATAVPDVEEDEWIDYAFVSSGTLASFSVVTSSTGGAGDSDMHVFAPGIVPVFSAAQLTFTNYTCRPWNFGSAETCNLPDPVAGTYRIRFYNYPGDGTLSGMTATLSHP